jgi:xanthine dehydrogenase accessory factor
MREIAAEVRGALAAGRGVQVGRVVAFKGFGGRRAGEAIAVFQDGPASGSLLGGLADTAIAESFTSDRPSLLEFGVGDTEAVAAGLACGGIATVLASDAAALPAEVWEALENGWPVAVVTRPDREAGSSALALVDNPAKGTLERHGSLGDSAADEEATQEARQALRLGRDTSQVIQLEGDVGVVVETYFPTTTLVVVGEGQLAEALAAQAGLLGWSAEISSDWTERADERIRSLGPPDAVVVLSHDPQVDTPALAAALAAGCYVGALGSRHTQAARRDRLRGAHYGLGDDAIDRIHGPVGLDLGARTPEETAVAVVGEILAHRSGRSAVSLRASSGPING